MKVCTPLNTTYLISHAISIFEILKLNASTGSVGFIFRTESTGDIPEIDNTGSIRRKGLYEAAVDGCWWKAKSILKIHRNAATEAIVPNGNTILHVAVEMGNNYLVEKLLEFLKGREVIEKKNLNGLTALHVAALVDNTDAAQLLLQKRKELLKIEGGNDLTPLETAFANENLSTCACMLGWEPLSDHSEDFLESALFAAILAKQYGEYLYCLWQMCWVDM
ncbi:putative ankyrin repeat-containing domain-containing protein [Helianthus annuus]|nr:putative ankyrin repeat-containing domain-containing protein [Helianthus annuus]KAJ0772706.1 putative ankyrin repeat-containing domain-containing protein [Helianthus annuus]KAJ0942211.1 putative ankyrin repeat-containing domain-containing protein [Helianthus annuus]